MQNPKPDMIYIHRLNKPMECWQLKFRHRGRVIHRERFRDDRYAGKEQALAAAIKKRNRIVHCLGINIIELKHRKRLRWFHPNPSKRSTSLVSGVYPQGIYWRAEISIKPFKAQYKLFSISELGEAEAFSRACAQRKEWEKKFVDQILTTSNVAKIK